MAYSELYVCDTCDYDATLVHAEEWQAGRNGEISPYPGYGAFGGLVNRLWCPECQTVRPYVFLRLSPPADHAVVAYAEAQRLGCDGRETGPCPACRTELTWQADTVPCPSCKTGTLRYTGGWE
jgi:hypothetical protein